MTESAGQMATCPMAKMCGRIMEKPHSGSLLMLPGALLIVLGVLIFVEPRIVIWLVGSFAILMGVMFLMMARFIGRFHKPPVGT
jgi:uncharacterized membrane protein HdeD (DUF308 family)